MVSSRAHARDLYASNLGSSMAKIETERLRYNFWKQLLKKSNKKTPLFSKISATKAAAKEQFISKNAGITGVKYQYIILKNAARVQLSIESKYTDKNKRIFDILHESKARIERDFGERLVWERNNKLISSRIKKIFENRGLNDKHDWGKIQDEMISAMIRLERALSKHIQKMTWILL